MKKALLILSALILISLASATSTQITVLTIPNAEVTINILNSNYESLQSFVVNASSSGQATATTTVDSSSMIISIIIRDFGSIVKGPKKFEGYSTGSPIVIDMTDTTTTTTPPPATTPNTTTTTTTTNTTTTNTTNTTTTPPATTNTTTTTTNSTKNNSSMLGYLSKSLSSLGSGIKNNYIYILIGLGAIIIIIVIIFIIKKFWGKIHLGKDPEDKEIVETEKKVKYLQREVDIIKARKSRLQELNKKFKNLQKELKVLKVQENI